MLTGPKVRLEKAILVSVISAIECCFHRGADACAAALLSSRLAFANKLLVPTTNHEYEAELLEL